ERLGDEQPLLLAARELADRLPGVPACADELEHLGDARCLARPRGQARDRNAPAGAVETELDDVDAADADAGVEVPPLGQVADPAVRLAGRAPQDRGASRGEREQPE